MVVLYKELTGKRRCLIDFQLTEEEFAAIGRVTTQWAVLEHCLYSDTVALAEAAKAPLPEDATNLSFKRRLRAWRLLGEEVLLEPYRQKHMRNSSRIANLEDDRHRITHGLWEWDLDNPEKLTAKSLRPGREFEKPFDLAKIVELSKRIAEINCRFLFPEGLKSMLAPYTDENGHVAFASTPRPQYRAQSTPIKVSPPQPTPPKRKRPQSSSKK